MRDRVDAVLPESAIGRWTRRTLTSYDRRGLRVKVLLACNSPRADRLGSARTPLRLEPELVSLGVNVRSVYADELPQRPGGRAGVLSAPLRMALAARRLGRDAG